jgi:hypothetical protein
MVGRAKTQRQHNKAAADFKDTWMQRAIEIYHQEQQLPKPRSQEKICRQAEAECFQLTRKVVKLSSSTLDRRAKGGQSHKEGHKGQRWLNDDENEAVLQDIVLNAQRGFPPTHRQSLSTTWQWLIGKQRKLLPNWNEDDQAGRNPSGSKIMGQR